MIRPIVMSALLIGCASAGSQFDGIARETEADESRQIAARLIDDYDDYVWTSAYLEQCGRPDLAKQVLEASERVIGRVDKKTYNENTRAQTRSFLHGYRVGFKDSAVFHRQMITPELCQKAEEGAGILLNR